MQKQDEIAGIILGLNEEAAGRELTAKLAQSRAEGFREGIEHAVESFKTAGFISTDANHDMVVANEAVSSFIYELCKELDISGQDIRYNDKMCNEEKAEVLAKRILGSIRPEG